VSEDNDHNDHNEQVTADTEIIERRSLTATLIQAGATVVGPWGSRIHRAQAWEAGQAEGCSTASTGAAEGPSRTR
jgi:hypothetical protein